MNDEFVGDPTPLQAGDFQKAARDLGCDVAAVRAVAHVESDGGGFLIDGRPKILFERHVFHARTGGRFGGENPTISNPRRGGYLGGRREYDRLHAAILLDRRAALLSASWGKFQVMGFNHALVGHRDVEAFVKAMVSGEPAQLAAFVAFIKVNRLDAALIHRDWAGFARGYNGTDYARDGYDRKLAAAYDMYRTAGAPMPVLRLGDVGAPVARAQKLLGAAADGTFGPATRNRVVALQTSMGLATDGIIGERTWAAMLG